ncbi:MAG: PLP-dependent aminotransferase family protein [Rhizobacter sp.]|nr:PLP-dependent aminotransferase family protein [Rhizobacter sp.]
MNQASPFKLARRAAAMNPSVIREILKLTEKGGVISFAGGLPSPRTFPVEAMREACEQVLRDHPREALQYSASEGYAPLVEWVAGDLARQGLAVDPAQVLITTGSQQGLDLVAKVLIDEGSTVLVESPTYLGALQAFTPMQPHFAGVAHDDEGPLPEAMAAAASGVDARFFYLLPNFQNPTGRSIGDARRAALVERAAAIGLPLVEDNPYGDLWFDAPPPPSLAGRNRAGAVYLGSFSKVLAPGLRLGYVVAPGTLMPKLLQAKQAADLHTPSFNQRIVYEVIRNGFLDRHVPTIRALYKAQRDAMLAALERHMPEGVRWNRPAGGMFLWVELPASMNATGLLPFAVERGVAFVPGAPFFSGAPQSNTLRLSFVTASEAQIETGITALGDAIRAALRQAEQGAA